jgi:hypothetical protein
MSDLQIGSDQDLALVNGDLALCTFENEIPQLIKRRLRFFQGEWFLDESLGVPYFEEILVKNPSPIAVDGIFKRTIVETPGVIDLLSFDMDYDGPTRKFTLSFEARSVNGTLVFNEEIV